MSDELRDAARAREITRLCHFTPSRNLQHIAAGKVGILATRRLSETERAAYNPTDLARYDGRTSHVCCSIEFPNGWYFDRARSNELLFPDWVVLLIQPHYIWREGTLFCPRNAAAGGGAYISSGMDGFEAMFAPRVAGAYGRNYVRSAAQLACCPTDQQAELLIEDCVELSDLIAVAVRSQEQAATERARLRTNGVDPDLFTFVVAPYMFSKYDLNAAISYGLRPSEDVYVSPIDKIGPR